MDDDNDDFFFVECGNEDEPDKDVPDEDIPDAGKDTESDDEEEADSLQMVFANQSAITKLRKIVSLFHRSSVKNEILQKFVKRMNNGIKLKLMKDSKTRCGSLHDACERFLKLLGPLNEALNHRETNKTYLRADIVSKRLKELVEVLSPAKLAIQFLSKKSVKLIDCNTTTKFLWENFEMHDHQLSQDIFLASKEKINKRRHDVVQSLILYLHDINSINGPNHFGTSTIAAMSKPAVKLMERFFSTENDNCVEQPEQQEEPSASTSQQAQRSLAEQLTLALKASREVTNKQAGKVIDFKKEMQMYVKTKVRSPTLDRLFEGLKTMQATSVAAERRFSEANILVSKVRVCDENINAISFLKCYFQNKLIK